MLLTNDIFSQVELASALGARETDTDLGHTAVLRADTIRAQAEQMLAGLVERHGASAKAVLVGHSYGGYLALEFAKHWPEKVAGLALISTQCTADTPGTAGRREKQIALLRETSIDTVLEPMFPFLLSEATLGDSATIAMIKRMAHTVGAETFVKQLRACAVRSDHRDTLRKLPPEIPVLVYSGKQDKLIPPRAMAEMRKLLEIREATAANSASAAVAPWRTIACKGSGHLVPLEQPKALRDALVSWTTTVDARGG